MSSRYNTTHTFWTTSKPKQRNKKKNGARARRTRKKKPLKIYDYHKSWRNTHKYLNSSYFFAFILLVSRLVWLLLMLFAVLVYIHWHKIVNALRFTNINNGHYFALWWNIIWSFVRFFFSLSLFLFIYLFSTFGGGKVLTIMMVSGAPITRLPCEILNVQIICANSWTNRGAFVSILYLVGFVIARRQHQ